MWIDGVDSEGKSLVNSWPQQMILFFPVPRVQNAKMALDRYLADSNAYGPTAC